MRARWAALVLLVALLPSGSEARRRAARDSRTLGLGKSCSKASECKSRSQRCLKLADMNGKVEKEGFCVLPCVAIDAGTTKVVPGQPLDPEQAKRDSARDAKRPPARCPAHYQCHGQDASTPFDLCVAE